METWNTGRYVNSNGKAKTPAQLDTDQRIPSLSTLHHSLDVRRDSDQLEDGKIYGKLWEKLKI
jgi:hypothetical protein